MEINEGNLNSISFYLRQTLSPDVIVRRPAEKFLESIETNQNYPLLLLKLVDTEEVGTMIQVASAVTFKNYIKRNWTCEDGHQDKIHATDRATIKQYIIDLMLKSPTLIQKQLSESISIMGKTDFPNKWPELVSQMVDKFATGDFHIINGVLQTAHSLFKKYRYEFKSNKLWIEIKFVLEKLSQPLTDLLLATMNLTKTYADNEAALRVIYSSLVLVCKVFYSLNYQDLPEFFEDNMETWMGSFHVMLIADVACLQTGENEEAGVLEELKSQVCHNVALYAQKYDEEFRPFLPQFVTDIWNVLVRTGAQTKYDLMVSNALQFLTSVAERAQYSGLFSDGNVLDTICKDVIIPNMEFRTCDEELFEDDPDEYIRLNIEGLDLETRRRAACDLVNVLSVHFEERIMAIFSQYLDVMLGKYAENNAQNWRSKDAVMYLMTSIVSRGQTEKTGVTQISQLVPLPEFHRLHVLPELERQNVDEMPVLKADAMKYVLTFRSVLPPELIIPCLPQLIRHLSAESVVVHTCAACTIEKILTLRNKENKILVKGDDLALLANDLLCGLFGVLDKQGSAENEYAMKAIMRAFLTLQERVVPYLTTLLPKLTTKLQVVANNPSKPNFNHFLFETLAVSMKIVCTQTPTAVSSFEDVLFPIFQTILQKDVQEFIPYVFQLLSLMLELTPTGNISEPYMQLLPCLLAPALWERAANGSPLVMLLCSFITHAAPQILAQDKLGGILGIFQKLVASKSNDREGFKLLLKIIQYFPQDTLQQYYRQIFFLLFQRLSSGKTTQFVTGLMNFFCFFCIKFSPSALISVIDGIQAQMFGMVLENIFIADMQRVSDLVDRKITSCGITKILCGCPEVINGQYSKYWIPLLEAMLEFFELPIDESLLMDDLLEVDMPMHSSFTKLNYAKVAKEDPIKDINDPRLFLIENLQNLGAQQPGRLPMLLNSLSPQILAVIQQYSSKYGVQLI